MAHLNGEDCLHLHSYHTRELFSRQLLFEAMFKNIGYHLLKMLSKTTRSRVNPPLPDAAERRYLRKKRRFLRQKGSNIALKCFT